ncbi:MAG: hypothetical protein KGP01_06190 [Actinomycetales bacterium]|nr:hypothetical protein [Actinomycetales bacterium]
MKSATPRAAALAAAAILLATGTAPIAAGAEPAQSSASKTWVTGRGAHGQSIRVSQARGLPARGAVVRIVGRGFDETVGIYVGLCRVVPRGQVPTPCGGGADMTGSTQASAWVSSNPPPYGIGVAVPFGIDGKFDVRVKVGPTIGKFDCRKVKCAITVRADHTNTGFRGADVFVPVTFTKR